MRAPIPTLPTGRAHPHPEPISQASYSAVELMPGDRMVAMLDQHDLPHLERYRMLGSVEEVADGIQRMVVRGAPAIGIAAAYGLVLAAGSAPDDAAGFSARIASAGELLSGARPTAVNLVWAVRKMLEAAGGLAHESPAVRVAKLGTLARRIHAEDVASCRAMGAIGAERLRGKTRIVTHCNAGALATGGFGTALGVVRAMRAADTSVRVLACETRPYLQGARLTAWELQKDSVPVEIITDSMAGHFMRQGEVEVVVVGADRIAKNGDVANKIGTYSLACLAKHHGIPLVVVAPWSSIDLACATGDAIVIEERDPGEVLRMQTSDGEVAIAPAGVNARHPAFDVTPAGLVSLIVTERGVIEPVTEGGIAAQIA